MSHPHRHNPGPLNRPKKAFKSRFATKGSLKRSSKGRLDNVDSNIRLSARKASVLLKKSKADRRHQSDQIRSNKRQLVVDEHRLGRTNQGPPKLISIIALSNQVNLDQSLSLLLDQGALSDPQKNFCLSQYHPVTVSFPKFKSRLSFCKTHRNPLDNLLDMVKVSDIILFVVHIDDPIDSFGNALVTALLAQGMPSLIAAIVGLNNIPIKHKQDAKKSAIKAFEERLTADHRILNLDTAIDAENMIRHLSNLHCRTFWRDSSTYMLSNVIKWTPYDALSNRTEFQEFGTLELSGFARGRDLDCNNLIHLVGHGDFQLLRVDSALDPSPYDKDGSASYDDQMQLIGRLHSCFSSNLASDGGDSSPTPLAIADPEIQDTLIIQNEINDIDSYYSQSVIRDKKPSSQVKVRRIRVPKGTSSYQAEWFAYDEESEDDPSEDNGVKSECDDDQSGDSRDQSEGDQDSYEEEMEWIELDKANTSKKIFDQDRSYSRQQKSLEELIEDDLEFPDEIEIPEGELAQDAFRQYRCLKSFRTSPWDVSENLPLDYARIFQFTHFDRARRRIFNLLKYANKTIESGSYVTLVLKDVHQSVITSLNPKMPLIAVSLLPFENKFSVMHYILRKCPIYQEPISNEETFTFHVGFRRFQCPIMISESAQGANKFKLHPYMHNNCFYVISTISPICFTQQPTMLWKTNPNTSPKLAAIGSVKTCDPDRIILHKAILTGNIISIIKNCAVVRGMFFHPDDVKYYQKADLWTRTNAHGHIVDSLGTKGLFRAKFDKSITNSDIVCLSLYKRVFPSWAQIAQPPRMPSTSTALPMTYSSQVFEQNIEMACD